MVVDERHDRKRRGDIGSPGVSSMIMEDTSRSKWIRPIIGGFSGGVVGLLIGAIWIALAPDNGFGDLAAAAVTAVFLVPLGILVGVVGTILRDRRRG